MLDTVCIIYLILMETVMAMSMEYPVSNFVCPWHEGSEKKFCWDNPEKCDTCSIKVKTNRIEGKISLQSDRLVFLDNFL